MSRVKKSSLINRIEQADVAKKVNVLDLSSDQDLTIGLMNLLAIEDMVPNSQIADMVRGLRKKLMQPIVDKAVVKGDVWPILERMLMGVVAQIKIAENAQKNGDSASAYVAYDKAYELYAVFWGLVMFGVETIEMAN